MPEKKQRLDKFLTQTTALTRSLAKKALHRGEISVNGQQVKDAAMQISNLDTVVWQEVELHLTGKRYLLLNKPVGYECSAKSSSYPLVRDLLIGQPKLETINPVGRLDVNTSGLLLLTDDGQWLHRVIAPKYKRSKTYVADLAEPLVEEAEHLLKEGLQLEGESTPCLPAHLERISATQVKLTITEGRYHQVRRMFAALGNHVVALHRESLGGLVLNADELPVGQWRQLTATEIQLLNI